MSGKIVNLRQARKRKIRDESAKAGEANAVRFGVSKEDRAIRDRAQEKAGRHLDGHKRDED